jgi:ankyrin repeat protein
MTELRAASPPNRNRRWFQFSLRSLMILQAFISVARAGEIHRLLEDGQILKAKDLIAANPGLINSRGDMDQTPLHIAVARSERRMVRFLLATGASVNIKAYNEFTPLHVARDPEIVRLLIANKADIEAKDASGRAALENAASVCPFVRKGAELPERKIVRILLDAGAYFDIRSAIHLGDIDRVRTLLKEGPAQAKDKELMRFAAMDGRAAIVELLLDYKADPEDADYGGLPVLYFAVEHPDVVRLLLAAGANPTVILDYRGDGAGPIKRMKRTLLHEAASKGQIETARLLIAAGVPIDSRTAQGFTPLHLAIMNGQPDMVEFLLKQGAAIKPKTGVER